METSAVYMSKAIGLFGSFFSKCQLKSAVSIQPSQGDSTELRPTLPVKADLHSASVAESIKIEAAVLSVEKAVAVEVLVNAEALVFQTENILNNNQVILNEQDKTSIEEKLKCLKQILLNIYDGLGEPQDNCIDVPVQVDWIEEARRQYLEGLTSEVLIPKKQEIHELFTELQKNLNKANLELPQKILPRQSGFNTKRRYNKNLLEKTSKNVEWNKNIERIEVIESDEYNLKIRTPTTKHKESQ